MGKRPYPIERDIERWRQTATRPDHIEQPGPGQESVWDYPDPYEPYAELLGYISFYASRLHACFVGDEQATPQPGGFYGGWVTSNITGPIKRRAWLRKLVADGLASQTDRPKPLDACPNGRLKA